MYNSLSQDFWVAFAYFLPNFGEKLKNIPGMAKIGEICLNSSSQKIFNWRHFYRTHVTVVQNLNWWASLLYGEYSSLYGEHSSFWPDRIFIMMTDKEHYRMIFPASSKLEKFKNFSLSSTSDFCPKVPIFAQIFPFHFFIETNYVLIKQWGEILWKKDFYEKHFFLSKFGVKNGFVSFDSEIIVLFTSSSRNAKTVEARAAATFYELCISNRIFDKKKYRRRFLLWSGLGCPGRKNPKKRHNLLGLGPIYFIFYMLCKIVYAIEWANNISGQHK